MKCYINVSTGANQKHLFPFTNPFGRHYVMGIIVGLNFSGHAILLL